MKKYIKIISISCAVLMFFSGCQTNVDEAQTTQATEATETSYTPKEIKGGLATIPDISIEQLPLPDNDALKFISNMKIGWNLGNTFDATRDGDYNEATEMDIEKSWNGFETTIEMILDIKNAGFNTLRLPVSWHNHLVDDNYTISEQWLNRVNEVVDYAIDNGMYVILNTHHDDELFYPSSEKLEISEKYIESVWTQLAKRFADYDNHLIFEGMNEPRLKGTNHEWNFVASNPSCQDSADALNKLNQIFVDTVRAGGGKNTDRYLMIPAYAASPESALSDLFILPTDIADNKLIVSVHAYRPYNFALQSFTEKGSVNKFDIDDKGHTGAITSFMDSLYSKYTANGIPVVIGEFGARVKNDNLQDRVNCLAYYIACAKSRGFTCCIWDNNAFSGTGENFGLYDRSAKKWGFPDVILAMMEYAE